MIHDSESEELIMLKLLGYVLFGCFIIGAGMAIGEHSDEIFGEDGKKWILIICIGLALYSTIK